MHPFFNPPLLLSVVVAWSGTPGWAATIRQGIPDEEPAMIRSAVVSPPIPSVPFIATPTVPRPTPVVVQVPSRRRTYYSPSFDDDRKPIYDDDREPIYDDDREPTIGDDRVDLPSYYDNPSRSDDDNDKFSDNFDSVNAIRGPALIVVIIMFVVSMIIIICGWNLASEDLALNESPDVLVQAFHEKLFQDKHMTFTIPEFEVPSPCGGGRPLFQKTRATRHALFFTTRIKCKWKPFCAWVQFFMGWVSLCTSIVGLFAPANTVNSVLGCGAMFTSEVLVHVWYGYFRYPNVATWCDLQDLDMDFFDRVKNYSTILYHGDREHREDKRIEYIGFIPTIAFHVSAFAFIVVMLIALSYGQSNNNNNRSNNSVRELLPCVVWIGALLGSLVYPLCFLFITHPIVKILAPILHHIAQEYYEAKLFEKDLYHLCLSIFFKFFGETLLPIFDEPNETISGTKGGFENVVEELDIKNEEEYKRNDVTRNETESNEDEEDEEIPDQVHPTSLNAPIGEVELEAETKFPASKASIKDVFPDDRKGASLDPPGSRDDPGDAD
jgi:hypothetical protein